MNTITNLNTFPIGNSLDGVNIVTEEINTLSLLVDGTNSMIADLNMNNHAIKNMNAGVDSLDAVNFSQLTDLRSYTDSSLNSLRSYTDSSLNSLRSYTDASLNLKVNKAGDTMTGFLQIPEIRLTGQTTTFNVGSVIDSSNRTNTYAVFDSAGATTDCAFLRQIGGSNDIHISLDFHDDNNDGKFSLRNIVSTANPDTIRPFFTSTPTGTIINYPSSSANTDKQLSLRVNDNANNGLFFHSNLTATAYNPLVSSGDKGLIFSNGTTETGNLFIGPWSSLNKGIKIVGASGNIGIGTSTPSERMDISGNSIIRGSLSMNTTNKIVNLANGTDNLDAVNFSQLSDLRSYTDSSLNSLRSYTDSSLNSLRSYTDSSLNLLRSYTDSSLNLLRNYTDASLNLKVNKAGDTMTNYLQLPEIRLSGQTTTYEPGNPIDVGNRTNTYAVFDSSGAATDWAYLRQIGGDNDFHLSIDFHDDDNDGKFSLRNVVSTANPDTIKPFFTSTATGTTINKNSTTSSNNLNITSSQTVEIKSGNALYDRYTLTYNGLGTTFRLPYLTQNDTTLQNKSIAFKITGSTEVFLTSLLLTGAFTTIKVDGVNYVSTTLTKTSSFILKGTGTIGEYTTHPYEEYTDTDQLVIKSNIDTNTNTEFTGIKFLNTNTDAGYIRTETDRQHNNSVMRFYTRSSNNIILPLELSNVITANKPIIRKEWSNGELVKTSVYGGSGLNKTVSDNNTWVEIVSLTFTADANIALDSCAFVINFNTSYYINGWGSDDAYSKVSDVTGTEQVIQITRQRYEDNNGGGSRSGTIFPVMCQYTPSQSTGNKTRTIKIYAKLSSGGGDTIYISNNNNESANYWYAEIRQIYSG